VEDLARLEGRGHDGPLNEEFRETHSPPPAGPTLAAVSV
jgi:hypothetical protein